MQELIDRARELVDRQPGLDPGAAMRRVLQSDRELLAKWHRGEADGAPPPPPVEPAHDDPGEALMAAIAAKVAIGADRDEARRQVFAAYPTLAACYMRGELIPRQPSKVGPPVEIVAFKAPMGGTVAGDTIIGVEIFRPGTWNGTKYDSKAIDDMVAAFDKVGYRAPVSIGHNAAEDDLAHGFVERLYRKGDVLMADLAGVPAETIQAIRDGRILSVSAEIYIGLKRGGRTFPYAIRALSLLGAHPPGVNLRPIAESLPAAA